MEDVDGAMSTHGEAASTVMKERHSTGGGHGGTRGATHTGVGQPVVRRRQARAQGPLVDQPHHRLRRVLSSSAATSRSDLTPWPTTASSLATASANASCNKDPRNRP